MVHFCSNPILLNIVIAKLKSTDIFKMIYLEKEISTYTLQELELIYSNLKVAENRREEASKHIKFNEDREIKGKRVPKMEFPPPNPAFLELKAEIELEIERKKKS